MDLKDLKYMSPIRLVMIHIKCMFCNETKNIHMRFVDKCEYYTGWICCNKCIQHAEFSFNIEKEFFKTIGLGLFGITTNTPIKIPRSSGEITNGYINCNYFLMHYNETIRKKQIGVSTTWIMDNLPYEKFVSLDQFVLLNNLDYSNLNQQKIIESYKYYLVMHGKCNKNEQDKLTYLSLEFWNLLNEAFNKTK